MWLKEMECLFHQKINLIFLVQLFYESFWSFSDHFSVPKADKVEKYWNNV